MFETGKAEKKVKKVSAVFFKLLFFVWVIFCISCARAGDVPVCYYRVINSYPHDVRSSTQGLVFKDGYLYESSGGRGSSVMSQVELTTGKMLQGYKLPSNLFGEGLTVYDDKIVQLTWQAGKGFVYDRQSFKLIKEFKYPHEGWGITFDGSRLIVSDGSARLRFWDPETFKETGYVEVYNNQGPVHHLNELEYINGKVYANVWKTDQVAVICPETGRVESWIDLKNLVKLDNDAGPGPGVLNGIAYDETGDRLFVTGKLWSRLFEIRLVP